MDRNVLHHFPVDFKFLFVPGRICTVFAHCMHTALISSNSSFDASGVSLLATVLFQFSVQEIHPASYSWLG
jgi:hypothetical protein